MSNDINFLYTRNNRVASTLSGQLKLLRTIALSLLTLVALLAAGLFILVIASPLPTLQEEENKLITTLANDKSTITQHTLLTTRIGQVEGIIKNRNGIIERIKKITEITPSNITVEGYEIDDEGLRLIVVSQSLEALKEYQKTLSSLVADEDSYKTLKIVNFTLANDHYLMESFITLK